MLREKELSPAFAEFHSLTRPVQFFPPPPLHQPFQRGYRSLRDLEAVVYALADLPSRESQDMPSEAGELVVAHPVFRQRFRHGVVALPRDSFEGQCLPAQGNPSCSRYASPSPQILLRGRSPVALVYQPAFHISIAGIKECQSLETGSGEVTPSRTRYVTHIRAVPFETIHRVLYLAHPVPLTVLCPGAILHRDREIHQRRQDTAVGGVQRNPPILQ